MRLVHTWLCQVLAFHCWCHQCFHASIAILSHLCLFKMNTQYACLYLYYHINCSFEMVWPVLMQWLVSIHKIPKLILTNILFFPINYAFFIHLSSLVFSPYSIGWCQCHTTQSLGIHQILKFFLTSYLVFIISLSISQVWSLFLTHLAMQIAFFNLLFIYLQVRLPLLVTLSLI